MLKILEDESVHSFIYRTHAVNGVFDYSNIISSKGKWVQFPKILKNSLPLYEPINEAEILRVLRDIGLARTPDTIFQSPFGYRQTLKSFFRFHRTRRASSNKAIKYCLDCIKEQIKKYGVGYINVTWSSNNHCALHKSQLSRLNHSNRAGAVKALKSIYRGVHPKGSSTESYVSSYFSDFRDYYHEKKVDYLAPCLEQKFKQFIQERRSTFPECVSESIRFSITDLEKGKDYLTKPHMMAKVYKSLYENNADVLVSFWSQSARKKTIGSGVIKRQSLQEEIFKDKEVDCQRCKYFLCFANQLIAKTEPDQSLIGSCKNVYCNVNYSYYPPGHTRNFEHDG